MADATMPVATTSRIIPLIMNEAPDLRAALRARRESRQCARIEQRRLLRGGHSRGKLRARSTVSFSRQRKIFDPALFPLRCQRRLVPAVERRHLDLAAIGAVASGLSAPAAAKSMHWSSSWSPMARLLGSARTWVADG
jgi:hypothetical protein